MTRITICEIFDKANQNTTLKCEDEGPVVSLAASHRFEEKEDLPIFESVSERVLEIAVL